MKEMIQKHPLLKRFLMTLAATTISIVLTFGTTAIIDWTKQKAEKREMAMMILYNLHETLTEAERCDENLRTYFDIQLDVVAHPQKMDGNFANLAAAIPQFDYTTTTENIFNSTIETLQTIGNILFVETVSSFYDHRAHYKSDVVDRFEASAYAATQDYDSLQRLDTPAYIFLSESYLRLMQRDYEQCKLMMKVTDEDLEAFSAKQRKLRGATKGNDSEKTAESALDQNRRRNDLENAREAGRKELQ